MKKKSKIFLMRLLKIKKFQLRKRLKNLIKKNAKKRFKEQGRIVDGIQGVGFSQEINEVKHPIIH